MPTRTQTLLILRNLKLSVAYKMKTGAKIDTEFGAKSDDKHVIDAIVNNDIEAQGPKSF